MHREILIANNGLIAECDKDESVEVTWDATASCLKIITQIRKYFCNWTICTVEIIIVTEKMYFKHS